MDIRNLIHIYCGIISSCKEKEIKKFESKLVELEYIILCQPRPKKINAACLLFVDLSLICGSESLAVYITWKNLRNKKVKKNREVSDCEGRNGKTTVIRLGRG